MMIRLLVVIAGLGLLGACGALDESSPADRVTTAKEVQIIAPVVVNPGTIRAGADTVPTCPGLIRMGADGSPSCPTGTIRMGADGSPTCSCPIR
jgi:hypothetical protein